MAFLKTIFPFLAFVVMSHVLLSSCEAREFLVDGKENSWKIPSSPDEFNKWAEKTRFQIGDSLVLSYDSKSDSVLQVSEEDYKSCNKGKPLKSYNDGKTKIVLDRSGPFFFISGAEGHCEKGQKLEVEVLSAAHSSTHSPSPAPNAGIPAPAPTNGSHGLKVGITFAILAIALGSFFL